MYVEEAGIRSPIAKFFHGDLLEEITHELEGKPGDLLLFVAADAQRPAVPWGLCA